MSNAPKITAANLAGRLNTNPGRGTSNGIPKAMAPTGVGVKPAASTAKLPRTYINKK